MKLVKIWELSPINKDDNVYIQTINKLTINKDDNMYIHTAPVLKVAQLYRKLIASFIGIAAEGIMILPKMNLIVLIAVKSGLAY